MTCAAVFRFCVAVQDERPIGFVAVAHREASRSAEIDMIAVDPD